LLSCREAKTTCTPQGRGALLRTLRFSTAHNSYAAGRTLVPLEGKRPELRKERNNRRGEHITSRFTQSPFAVATPDSSQDLHRPFLVEWSHSRRTGECRKGLSLVFRPMDNRRRLLLDPRIPTRYCSLASWRSFGAGNSRVCPGHPTGSCPGVCTGGTTLLSGPGFDRPARKRVRSYNSHQ
jgi:hypothetical protein